MSANLDRDPDDELAGDLAVDNWLSLELYLRADRTELLIGLDRLLELNLINQQQVKQLARQHLSCVLPQTFLPVILDEVNTEEESAKLPEPAKPNAVARIVQNLLQELSIRWLLFLGIFLVVLSSGVLAASQWQSFPVSAQYLVLFVYTMAFWGSGIWADKQDNLSLTAQTLKAIATLLVPINFWAIDRLGLGANLRGYFIVAVATVMLGVVVWSSPLRSAGKRKNPRQFYFYAYSIFSCLHLGWGIAGLPLVAVYGGIISLALVESQLKLQKSHLVAFLYLLAGWLLLLLRGLTTDRSIIHYSLAIAIFASAIANLSLRYMQIETDSPLESESEISTVKLLPIVQIFSSVLFFSTWIASIIAGTNILPSFFWQTIAIDGLILRLFAKRLVIWWRKFDLTAIFFIGLQTLYLAKELIPLSWRGSAMELATDLSQTEYFPESVFGVTLFPYVILFIGVASWLYRRQKTQLALYAEYLTFCLGVALTCLSFVNPTWRSLNLILSTLTLGYLSRVRQRRSLVYLTHLLALITLTNCIHWLLPNLGLAVWGNILVLMAVLEWLLCLRQGKSKLQKLFDTSSCWYFGLLLATASYSCFGAFIYNFPTSDRFYWSLTWLAIPLMLTAIAKYTPKLYRRRQAVVLSCSALVMAQLLLIINPVTRFVGLLLAVILMGQSIFYYRRLAIALLHIGFGLTLVVSSLYTVSDNSLDIWQGLAIASGCILGLYQLRSRLRQSIDAPLGYISQRFAHGILGVGIEARNFKLVNKYITAADYWAIALISLLFTVLGLIYPFLGSLILSQRIYYLFAVTLLIGALLWRYRKQPNNLVLYGLTCLGSMFAIALIALVTRHSFTFAAVNIVLGLSALLVVDRYRSNSVWSGLHLSAIPLIYAILSILWRGGSFTAYTGWLTIGAAIVLLDLDSNSSRINSLTNYLGCFGITWGIYELVIYQMQSATGGSLSDALTILALVAAAIAFLYRSAAWWYGRSRFVLFHLKRSQVVLVAHLHWAMGSLLKILAAGIALETATPRLTAVSIATSICLGGYAVIQGRDRDNDRANDWWVYVGLVEIIATLVYSRLIFSRLSLFDPWRVLFTCAIALLIYQIPWSAVGWRTTPWQRTAFILPGLMALVTAEDISYFSLLVTALFYLRVAYGQQNVRWSYLSLGLFDWAIVRYVWQYNTEFIWLAGAISLSLLYLAQYDPYFQTHYAQRHRLRLLGSSIVCLTALFYQPAIPSAIALCFIFGGLGLRIRAFLYVGTITLVLTAIHQLVILVLAYSFLKWVVGLLAGICSIAIAAGFEQQRERASRQLKNYNSKLKNWQ